MKSLPGPRTLQPSSVRTSDLVPTFILYSGAELVFVCCCSFLLRQAKRWLPFLCVTDYSDVPSSCDPFIQDLKLWGFRDLLYIAILTGTPRGTTPTPRRKGTRSCCLPSMIFRFVTSLVTPGVYIFPFSLPTLEPRRKLVDCGQEGLVERLPLVLLHQQVHCLL